MQKRIVMCKSVKLVCLRWLIFKRSLRDCNQHSLWRGITPPFLYALNIHLPNFFVTISTGQFLVKHNSSGKAIDFLIEPIPVARGLWSWSKMKKIFLRDLIVRQILVWLKNFSFCFVEATYPVRNRKVTNEFKKINELTVYTVQWNDAVIPSQCSINLN